MDSFACEVSTSSLMRTEWHSASDDLVTSKASYQVRKYVA